MISKEAQNWLYDWIVGTNNEYIVVADCKKEGNKKVAEELEKWFQIGDDEDEEI